MMKGERRTILYAMFAVAILAVLAMPIAAQVEVKINTTITAAPGGTVNDYIWVLGPVTSLGAGNINLTYNSSVVHVTSVTAGTAGGIIIPNIQNASGWTRIGYLNTDTGGVSGNVSYCTITFQSVGAPTEVSPLNLTVITLADTGYADIPHTVTNGTFSIQAPTPPVGTNVVLYKNWNFISVPKKLAEGNNTFSQVFGMVNTSGHSISYYDTLIGWGAVNASEEVKPLRGYWIYSVEDTVVNLTYDTYPLRTPPTRQLNKGWNAIGLSDTVPAEANSALTSVEKSWAYLIGFDAGSQVYESAIINNDETGGVHDEDSLMYPMKGYWVYVTEDCELAGIGI